MPQVNPGDSETRTQEVFGGRGALESAFERVSGKTALVVHGRGSFSASGAEEVFARFGAVSFYFFVDVETNPSSTSVRSCAELLRAKRPEVVFAVGGGSAIDTAKAAIAYLYADDEDAVFRNRFTVPDDRPIFVCVPTTAGSGSEATHFAVVYRDGVKYSIKHPHLKPDVAVLDPTLTLSCPRELTLAAGSDAVCQAVESWWSNGADSTSRARAVQALSALVPNLIRVADKPDDIDAREAMMTGAYAAGRAIDITTTTAGHAMAYGLTTSFGLPHGLAVLAVMRALVAFMSERSALVEVSRALTPMFSPYGGEFAVAFHALTVEIFRRIEWSGYPFPRGTDEIETAAARLAAGVNVERLANHPVSLDDRAIHDLYKTILNDQAARAT